MHRVNFVIGCLAVACLCFDVVARADWVTKSGFTDYACHNVGGVEQRTDGMPDFDQRQAGWVDVQGHWNWCGPVAAANCLWWFDSKFERIRMYGMNQQLPVRPSALSDHYSLISDVSGLHVDDHDPLNLIPFVNALVGALPGGVPNSGLTAAQMQLMVTNYLANRNLYGHYSVTIENRPTFGYIYHQVEISQNVILLLGFWQLDPSQGWGRFGGHWLTVAGADTQQQSNQISFSDPCADNAELGLGGIVWNGFLTPHLPVPGHPAVTHNDAGNVSHDWYPILGSTSPGGLISAGGYGIDDWENFENQNFDDTSPFSRPYNPGLPVHTEVEKVVVICPSFDYGDLGTDYPTIDIESCGPAHPLSDKAWLGAQVDAEIQPGILDLDNFDDGVIFLNTPWTPGTNVQVRVQVTTGAHFNSEALYLSAWIDGNTDGDFDDGPGPLEDDFLNATEWVIQDAAIGGPGVFTFTFCDPGIVGTPYNLIARFRLVSTPVGRHGYGGLWYGGVSNGLGSYDIDWVLGETEDYIITDAQLAVALRRFNAIARDGAAELVWTTASENDNGYFRLERVTAGDSWQEIARVPTHGNSATDQQYRCRDEGLVNGCQYEYRLTAVDIAGSETILATAAATPTAAPQVTAYALAQNYPNPFNPETAIRFELPTAVPVEVKVFNMNGQLVATLVDEVRGAGSHTVIWNGRNNQGLAVSTGMYIYQLKAGTFTDTKKMLLMK